MLIFAVSKSEGELDRRELYGCLPWLVYFFVVIQVLFADLFLVSREAAGLVSGAPKAFLIISLNIVAAIGLASFIGLVRRMKSARTLTLCYFGAILVLEVIVTAYAGAQGQLFENGVAAGSIATLIAPAMIFSRLITMPRSTWEDKSKPRKKKHTARL